MSNLFRIIPLEEHIGDKVAVPTVYRDYLLSGGIIGADLHESYNSTYPEYIGGGGSRIKGHPGALSLPHNNDLSIWKGNGTKKDPYRIDSLQCHYLIEETPTFETTAPNGARDNCCRFNEYINKPSQFLCATSGTVYFQWDNVELPNLNKQSATYGIPSASARIFNRQDNPASGWDFANQQRTSSKYLYSGPGHSADDGDPISVFNSAAESVVDRMKETGSTVVRSSGVVHNPDSVFGITTTDGFYTLYQGGYIDTSPGFRPIESVLGDVRIWFEAADGTEPIEFPDCPCGNILFPAGVDEDKTKGVYINVNNKKKYQLEHEESAGVNNGEKLITIANISESLPIAINNISIEFGEFYKQENNIINIFGPIYVEIKSKLSGSIVARKFINDVGKLYKINNGRIQFECSEILVNYLYNKDTLIVTIRSVCPETEEVCCAPRQQVSLKTDISNICVTDPCCFDLPTTVVFSSKSEARLVVRGPSKYFLDTGKIVTTKDISNNVIGQLADFIFTNNESNSYHFNYRPIFYGPSSPFVALPDITKGLADPCETQELQSREITLCAETFLKDDNYRDGSWIFRIDECCDDLIFTVYSENSTPWYLTAYDGAGNILESISGNITDTVNGLSLPQITCYGQEMPQNHPNVSMYHKDKYYSPTRERLI